MQFNLSLEAAQNLIRQNSSALSGEKISITSALGRVCAVEITAPVHLPGQNQSAVDGYALGGIADKYQLIGTAKPGEIPAISLQAQQALAVSTGDNLPEGTFAVIPHEKTELKDAILLPGETIKPGNNIKQAGEDFGRGDQLVGSGAVIGAAEIGLLAAFGITDIEVYRQPRVAVLSLSKNIVNWTAYPEPGQMRDSNGPLLASLVTRDGGLCVAYSAVGEEEKSGEKIAAELLEQVDILIITGGTYADGESEACSLMEKLGSEVLYWDVPVQPGSHTGFSRLNSRQIFALSGNPAACTVGYHLFVMPALKALQGLDPHLQQLKAVCRNGFPKKAGTRRFVRGHLAWTETGWQVTVLPGQKPSMLRSLLQCNALIDLPAGSPPIGAGGEVAVIVLEALQV